MSVPKDPSELFVLWAFDDNTDGLAVRKQTPLGTGVRYLRADLTCGECERGQNQTEPFCDRWTFFDDPACMAFVERKP